MSEVYSAHCVLNYPPEDGESERGVCAPDVVHASVDRHNLLPTLGLFGTVGKPDEVRDWRAPKIPEIAAELAARGLAGKVDIFNPVKAKWEPEDAVTEARHLARDAVVLLPILNLTSGHASLAETGFATLGSVLRPQKTHLYIESGYNYDDSVQRARALTTLLAQKTLKDFPINTTLTADLDAMIRNGIQDIEEFVNTTQSRVTCENRYIVERRTDLEPKIALVGSGASQHEGSWYEGMGRLLSNVNVRQSEQYSAYVKGWSIEKDAYIELEHKTNDAVVLFVATENENSYGAMGELGWLVTYCILNGQKLGVYVERHRSKDSSDQNRPRKLAMAHLGRLLLDFPDLPVFVASSPAELAWYGASELAKYKQFQKASKNAA